MRGFTLIETLVAITIFAILGAIVSTSLFSLLRGASRTESIKEVKQNGEQALNVLEVKLRNSTIADADCDGSTKKTLTLTDVNGAQIVYSCHVNDTKRIRQVTTPSSGPATTNYLTGTTVELSGAGCAGSVDLAFTCTKNAVTLQKYVSLEFGLQEKSIPATRQTFKMTVGLRNK